MIFLDELPLSLWYNKRVKHFYDVPDPQFIMLSQRSIIKEVRELFLEEKTMLCTITIGNASTNELAIKNIEAYSFEWGMERLCTITIGNASTNELAIKYVKRKMHIWKNVDAVVSQA